MADKIHSGKAVQAAASGKAKKERFRLIGFVMRQPKLIHTIPAAGVIEQAVAHFPGLLHDGFPGLGA